MTVLSARRKVVPAGLFGRSSIARNELRIARKWRMINVAMGSLLATLVASLSRGETAFRAGGCATGAALRAKTGFGAAAGSQGAMDDRASDRHVSSVTSSKPSSSQPVTPPVMILTGRPNSARRNAPRAAPLQ